MSTPAKNLGAVVTAELIAAGLSENAAAAATGIARQTLRRRLINGDFKADELIAVGDVLGIPASHLMARAEGRVA